MPAVLTPGVERRVPFARDAAPARHLMLRLRRPAIVVFHVLLVAAASYLALWLRFDGDIPLAQRAAFRELLPWLVLVRAVTFVPFGIYQGLWRYTGLWEVQRIVAAVAVSSMAAHALTHSWLGLAGYPRSVTVIDAIILIFLIGGVRLVGPLLAQLSSVKGQKRVLIVGAGDAGETIVRDMKRRRVHDPVGFVDDDRTKIGHRIHGVPVLGTREQLPALMKAHDPQEVLIAVPSAAPSMLQEVVTALRPFQARITKLPSLQDIVGGAAVTEIRSVSIEDLIARAPVGLDERPVRRLIEGRRVMVTGAGGSIGSELCRQIAALAPAALVLYERYENNLFAISTDLADRGASRHVHPVIGDVTDAARLDAVLRDYRPEIVFHAAAHKHVPLMEQNACEAVKNNVTGSRLLIEAAERFGVRRFILISSDKAVNPTSVMGATKRVAEIILQMHAEASPTHLSTVRFGNVLGSNGSVVPRFLEQIRAGGPVTITHPEIRRYFMLIPEAVQLVLHAAAQRTPGFVYVLDMGEQIRLIDLARNLIRLSGRAPDDEIAISFVGLRPGEKLFEELVGPGEGAHASATPKILEVGPRALKDPERLARQIAVLEQLAVRGDTAAVMRQIRQVVPEFNPPDGDRAIRRPVPDAGIRPAPAAVLDPHRAGYRSCPVCSSTRLTRSRTRSIAQHIRRSLTRKRLHRCLECGWRGWAAPVAESPEPWNDRAADASGLDFSAIDRVVAVASSHRVSPLRDLR